MNKPRQTFLLMEVFMYAKGGEGSQIKNEKKNDKEASYIQIVRGGCCEENRVM